MEEIHTLEPLNAISKHFSRVTIIDDSSIFFTLIGPTFVFSHLATLVGYLLLELLDRFELKRNSKFSKTRYLLSFLLFLSHSIGFFNYYRKYVRSYGKYTLFTSPNNILFPFLNMILLLFRRLYQVEEESD